MRRLPCSVYELLLCISTHATSMVLARPPFSKSYTPRPRPVVPDSAPAEARAHLARATRAAQARAMVLGDEFQRRARTILAMQQRWRRAAHELRGSYHEAVADRVRYGCSTHSGGGAWIDMTHVRHAGVRQDKLAERVRAWEASTNMQVFSDQAALERSVIVPKLRYTWDALQSFVDSGSRPNHDLAIFRTVRQARAWVAAP